MHNDTLYQIWRIFLSMPLQNKHLKSGIMPNESNLYIKKAYQGCCLDGRDRSIIINRDNMNTIEKEFYQILDLHPPLKTEVVRIINNLQAITETRQRLHDLRVRYIGESDELHWFADEVTGGSFTLVKGAFSPETLVAETTKLRRKFGIE